MIDPWDPKSFSAEIKHTLDSHSELIVNFFREDSKLMDEHLNSSPYQSLKSNLFHFEFSNFKENTLTPILKNSRIRVWHYTRLTDSEVDMMRKKLMLSSLDYLKDRLDSLVSNGLLSHKESEQVFGQSPFHRQRANRSGMLWTTTSPLPTTDTGVEPLLEHWGGESAYFWLSDEKVKTKLKNIGLPRVIEIEAELSDSLNAFSVSETVLQAWAKKLGVSVVPSGSDLAIKSSIEKAKVVKVHTKGQNLFNVLAKTYPENVQELISE
jgi:hypothetical protein